MSERTKSLKKLYRLFGLLSLVTFVGVALFAVISVFIKTGNPQMTKAGLEAAAESHDIKILNDDFVKKIVGFGVTTLILLVISLVMTNKLKTTVWIVSMIICTIIYGEVSMYIIAGIWLVNEYAFTPLAKHYKQKLTINKEIDLREVEHGTK